MPASATPPVLLLHGAWHGAWCWEPVTRALAARGTPVLAVDLPGGGLRSCDPVAYATQREPDLLTEVSPLGRLSAAACAEDVVPVLRELAAAHGPVVVVGHSLSGVVPHHLGEAVPELVRRLVYLAALAPAPGGTVFADAAGPAFADSLFLRLPISDPATTGVVRINWNASDEAYRATARTCFYNDVPEELAAAAGRMLTPDVPARLYSDPIALTAHRWGSLPRTWIVTTDDRAVPVRAQDLTISQLDAAFPEQRFERLELASGHSPFLSAPQALVDVLAGPIGR